VSNLRVPDFMQPWRATDEDYWSKPERIASALQIMIDGPIGAALSTMNSVARIFWGYFRTFEQRISANTARATLRGYHKPS